MLNEIKKDAESRMGKSIEALRHNLIKLRTGRANAAIVGFDDFSFLTTTQERLVSLVEDPSPATDWI